MPSTSPEGSAKMAVVAPFAPVPMMSTEVKSISSVSVGRTSVTSRFTKRQSVFIAQSFLHIDERLRMLTQYGQHKQCERRNLPYEHFVSMSWECVGERLKEGRKRGTWKIRKLMRHAHVLRKLKPHSVYSREKECASL